MKLGIKVGLKSDWKADLLATRPDFCEIWFDSSKIDAYADLFAYLQAGHIPAGIHFWGATKDGTLANFAYPNARILEESRQLLRKTITTAIKFNACYINLHPCGKTLTHVDFEKEEFTPYSDSIDTPQALGILEESLLEAARLIRNSGTILTLESVPKMALGNPWRGKNSRDKSINIGEMMISEVETLYRKYNHLWFANDFGHTCGNVFTSNRDEIKRWLFETTGRLADKTKLLHTGYIIPPYNGTDYHGCLYYDDFKTTDAIPNYTEMKELLNLFVKRSDVYVLAEPEMNHPQNFTTLKRLVEEL